MSENELKPQKHDVNNLDEDDIDLDNIGRQASVRTKLPFLKYNSSSNKIFESDVKENTNINQKKDILHIFSEYTGGYLINRTPILKLRIDDSQYVTIAINENTTVENAIDKIHKRRQVDKDICEIQANGKTLPPQTNLLSIIQSGALLQFNFQAPDPKSNKEEILSLKRKSSESEIENEHGFHSHLKLGKSKHKKRKSKTVKANLSIQFTVTTPDSKNLNNDDTTPETIEQLLSSIKDDIFNVVKINSMSRKQKRVLKITARGIANVRPKANYMSSFHTWDNIESAFEEDHKTIRISYKDRNDDRKYECDNAHEICNSINKRLEMIRNQKKKIEKEEVSFQFQKSLLNKQINQLKEFKVGDKVRLTRDRSGEIIYKGFVHYAPGIHCGIYLDEGIGDHDGMCCGIRYLTTPSNKCVIVPESHIIRKIKANKSPANSPSLSPSPVSTSQSFPFQQLDKDARNNSKDEKLTKAAKNIGEELTGEDSVFNDIKRCLLADDTKEGKWRRNFQSKFAEHEKSDVLLETIRDFMTQMKVRIIEEKGEKLVKLLIKYKNSISIETTKDTTLMPPLLLSSITPETNDIISSIIESAIEQTVLRPKIKDIEKICEEKTAEEKKVFKAKIDKLKNCDQEFFGIPNNLQSTNDWNTAVYELSQLRNCILPSEKIKSLVNTAHAIYLSHHKENTKDEDEHKKKAENFITGDDFLPIVIYVIVRASRIELAITHADLMFMEGLIDPELNRSEPGYYLAVFHAAIEWIRAFNFHPT